MKHTNDNIIIDCPCTRPESYLGGISGFEKLRSECEALNRVLLPENVWTNFKQYCVEDYDRALHRPFLFLSFERGVIHKITAPVHKYLLSDTACLSKQYQKDLVEKWMNKSSEHERRRYSLIYFGRIAELLITEYASNNGYIVEDLEALGGTHDLMLKNSVLGIKCAAEVKYIGVSLEIFTQYMNAFGDGNPCNSISPPGDGINRFLLRVYDAALQLGECKLNKLALIVLDPTQWHQVKHIEYDGWLDWDNIQFAPALSDWDTHLQFQKDTHPIKYNDIESRMTETIQRLSSICILTIDGGLNLKPMYTKQFRKCTCE